MKIVIDTNVLIAALISRGFCHELLEHCFLNHTLVTSDYILREVREKLIQKFNFAAEVADEAVSLFTSRMELVSPDVLAAPVCRDPDDDNILATARAGNCESIITGDKDLLVLQEFEGIRVLSPREFSEQENPRVP